MKKIGNSSLLMAVLEDLTPFKLPYEKTVQDFITDAKTSGYQVSRHIMERRLSSLSNAGKIKVRKGIVNGKSCNLYSEA